MLPDSRLVRRRCAVVRITENDPEPASYLRIEERQLKLDAGGRNWRFGSQRETCNALSSVLKSGRPASALLRRRACIDAFRVGGPPRLFSARHLPNHQLAGRHLLLNDFEFRLVPFAIAL